MNKNNKGFIGVLVAIAVAVLIGGGAYVVSNRMQKEPAPVVTVPGSEKAPTEQTTVPVEVLKDKSAATVKAEVAPQTIGQVKNEAILKAADAKMKATLTAVLVNAEVYYSTGNSYGTPGKQKDLCTGAGAPAMFSDASVAASFSMTSAEEKARFKCNVSIDGKAHAIWVKLAMGGYWCTDSQGASKPLITEPAAGATSCG